MSEMPHAVYGSPDAPALVLLHGFPFAGDMWDDVRSLLESGLRLIVPDLLRGDHLDGDPSIDRLANGIVAILDRHRVERATVVGLSMGGYVALSLVRDHPQRVAGLGLLNTRSAADTDEGRAARHALAERVVREGTAEMVTNQVQSLLGDTTHRERPDVVRRLRQLLEAASPQAVAWGSRAMAARPDTTDVLVNVDVPTLVLTADEDTLIPPSFSDAMVAALKKSSAHTTYVVVPGAGHMSAMERPEPVAAALRELVAASQV